MFLLIVQITTFVAAGLAAYFGVRLVHALREHELEKHRDCVLLAVKVSKLNEKQPIVAEQIFSVLHGIYHHHAWWRYILGVTQDRLSLEIANVDEQIFFYIHTPRQYQHFVENQIYAQYPDVEIAIVPDYAAEPPAMLSSKGNTPVPTVDDEAAAIENLRLSLLGGGKAVAPSTSSAGTSKPDETAIDYFANAVGVELHLANADIVPIKRYPQFEDKLNQTYVDPLSGITSTLSKLPSPHDRAMVQIIIRPLGDRWRRRAMKYAGLLAKELFFDIEKLKVGYIQMLVNGSIPVRLALFPISVIGFITGGFRTHAEGEKPTREPAALAGETRAKHDDEDITSASLDKVSRLAYQVSIRIAYVPHVPTRRTAEMKVREIAGGFKQFNQPHLNSFEMPTIGGREVFARYQKREIYHPFVLNIEELATLYHMPNIEVRTPNIAWVSSKKLEPPVNLPDPRKEMNLTVLGRTDYRGVDKEFGIRTEDRRRHIYIIGKTGMGKSTLLENMIVSDINEGKGVAVVDPHGDLCEHILENIPSNRLNDVVVFDPSDRDFPVAFNMLENIDPQMNSVVASGLVGIFKKIYAESWGPRLEHILRNTVLSLLEYPGATMLGIPRMYVDASFRHQVMKKITDPVVKRFWTDEFEAMQPKQLTEAIAPIQNKVGQFLSSSIIRNIIGQPKSMIDIRFAMDTKKIVICNLSKGKIGEDNSSLLGSMLITKFQLDAMSRANMPEKDRVDFYLYVDEFQNFATDSFATILSEARKYRLNLTMANQYVAQMSEEVRDAVFGNVGTIMTFQVGADDAELISKQFSEIVLPADLVQLPKYTLYSKLLVDGMPTQPFSAATMPPIPTEADDGRHEKVIRLSRERYAQKRDVVEDKIKRWSMNDDERDEVKSIRAPKEEKKELPAAVSKKELPPTEVKKQIVDAQPHEKEIVRHERAVVSGEHATHIIESSAQTMPPSTISGDEPLPKSYKAAPVVEVKPRVAPPTDKQPTQRTPVVTPTKPQPKKQPVVVTPTVPQPSKQADIVTSTKASPTAPLAAATPTDVPSSKQSSDVRPPDKGVARNERGVSSDKRVTATSPAVVVPQTNIPAPQLSAVVPQTDVQTKKQSEVVTATNIPSVQPSVVIPQADIRPQKQLPIVTPTDVTPKKEVDVVPSMHDALVAPLVPVTPTASQSSMQPEVVTPTDISASQPLARAPQSPAQSVQPVPTVPSSVIPPSQPVAQPMPLASQQLSTMPIPQPIASPHAQPMPASYPQQQMPRAMREPPMGGGFPQQAAPMPQPSAMPQLVPHEQQIVEQYTIYYQQYYRLSPPHARQAAIHAVMQARAQQQRPPMPSQHYQQQPQAFAQPSMPQQPMYAQPQPQPQHQPMGGGFPLSPSMPQTHPASGYQLPQMRPAPSQPPVNTLPQPPTASRAPQPPTTPMG